MTIGGKPAAEQIRRFERLEKAAEDLVKAIKRHRKNIWGGGKVVGHDQDIILYDALARFEEETSR